MNARTSFFVIAFTFFAAGCGGGSGSSTSGGSKNSPGLFHASYSRSSGDLTIGIADDGKVNAMLVDSDQETFVGSGTAESGTFNITCNGTLNRTVNLSGTISGSGSNAHVNGSISGIVTTDYTANYVAAPSSSLFVQHYVGSFTGTEAGTIVGAISANGQFVGTISFEHEATVLLDGTVTSTGYLDISGSSANASFGLKGMLDISDQTQVKGNGIWTSPSKGAGSWTISQTSDFIAG